MTFKSQKELFDYIWDTRPHKSEVSGEPLLPKGHYKFVWQFAHILNKGRFPHLKYDERNIILMLPEEHDHQDRYEEFNYRKEQLLKEVYQ